MEGIQNNNQKENLQSVRQKLEQESFMSDWGLDKYVEVLGLNIEEMKGKLVLDIGSGTNEKFKKEASDLGIEVISISPKEEQKSNVVARVQEMPFKDNTFDYEVALFSVPYYLHFNKDEYKKCFEEVIRTLKPEGKAYFSPVFKNKTLGDEFVPTEFIEEILNQFSDSISYTLEKINSTDKEYRLMLIKK